jgi:starch phosphorylase
VLDPEAFTIGFARRFATYKRATLLFRDVNRLKKLLTNDQMPVQIVIAGKAHPKDHPGKTLIREIYNLSRDPALSKRLVFLEDYGIEVARDMVQGVDLWLNNPRRGEEACGTSGMKASINGVLNLSILDGWFDEAYESSGGWAIGDRSDYSEDQDEHHAMSIYSLLENEIVPKYFGGGDDGIPDDWVRRMKQCLIHISPLFACQRMVEEYMNELYLPAHKSYVQMKASGYALARERSRWEAGVHQAWPGVHFVEMGPGPDASVVSGSSVPLRTVVNLGGLTPGDVRVEAVVGQVGTSGYLEHTQLVTLPATEQRGQAWLFEKEFVPERTGLLGFALRICPNHDDNPLTRPCNALIKWGQV